MADFVLITTNVRNSDGQVNDIFVGNFDTTSPATRQNVGMTNLEAIGQRVRALRKKAGLIQEELAAEVGTKRPTIAGIETGNDRGGIETMVAIADFFKVPMDWLLCRRVPPGGPLLGQFVDDPDELAWIAFWRSLTVEERGAAVKMLRIPVSPPGGR